MCGQLLNASEDVEKMEPVDLIASGYEWICPNCEYTNSEIEVMEVLECLFCNGIYRLGDYHHAIG